MATTSPPGPIADLNPMIDRLEDILTWVIDNLDPQLSPDMRRDAEKQARRLIEDLDILADRGNLP